MSRIAIPDIESATGATANMYAHVKRMTGGRVPNSSATLGHLAPACLAALFNAEDALALGSLGEQDILAIKLLVSARNGSEVCVATHSSAGRAAGMSAKVLRAIRTGEPTGNAKRDALMHFVSEVLGTTGTISEDEFTAIHAAGYGNRQLAEISLAVALTTFTNTFNRINGTDVDYPPVE